MIVIGHSDVADILRGSETEILDVVQSAYRLHDEGRTAVPHSVFLRFPDNDRNRIIGLPAYAGGPSPVAGMKWIASFPGNIERGVERASASILLNSLENGHPVALIEGSQISAKRTAASAAAAASVLLGEERPTGAAMIGCGVINLEVFRFLAAVLPRLRELTVFDTDHRRAQDFARACGAIVPGLAVAYADSVDHAVASHGLISIATTAPAPHMDLSEARVGSVVLHVSLRDLSVETILSVRNVVDDPDHVCRERTSLHLAELRTGNRDFIDASIGGLLRGSAGFERSPFETVVVSPFGLGVLDLALAQHVHREALRRGLGTTVDGFLPVARETAAAGVGASGRE